MIINFGTMKENLIDIIEKFGDTFNIFLDFYTGRFSYIIGVDFDYWVGDMREEDRAADRPSQPVDVAQFGDYFFNLSDIRTVVDNYRYWLQRYGTREAVGEEVCDWHDYVVERMSEKKNYINLFHWLNGAPRDINENKEGANG